MSFTTQKYLNLLSLNLNNFIDEVSFRRAFSSRKEGEKLYFDLVEFLVLDSELDPGTANKSQSYFKEQYWSWGVGSGDKAA